MTVWYSFMDNLTNQIDETLHRSICTGWDRAFLESIQAQVERGKILTSKQKTVLGRVLSQNTEEDEKYLEGWKEEYFLKFQKEAKIVSPYHMNHPYYTDMATDILKDKVPRRKQFIKMINNKYTQKVLREYHKSPRFKPGSYVKRKTNFDRVNMSFSKTCDPSDKFLSWDHKRHTFLNFMKKGALIIAVDDEIHSAAKGAKRYKLLGIGDTLPFYVEERYLKYG